MKKKSSIRIGTSGWYYEHWNEVFYPKGLPIKDRLHFFSESFSTIEINTTFYHLPRVDVVKNWDAQVFKDFVFSVKASRYITHMKRLNDCGEALQKFYERIEHLEDHLGPILFQLPPSFKEDLELLKTFCKNLSKKYRHVFEFRHPTWFKEEVYNFLHKNHLGLCITDLGGSLSPEVATTDFAYFRLHGPKLKYKGSYGTKKLKEWKEKLLSFQKQKITSYCYFDNDEKGYAIQDALELKTMIAES